MLLIKIAMDYQQRIIELTEHNNNLTILCHDLIDKVALQQLVSPDEYSNIRKQLDQLTDATIDDNIMLGNKLLVIKESLNNYLASCKKMEESVELQKNIIKKFKFNCTKHNKEEITDEFLLTMPYLEILDLKCEKCNYYCSEFLITDLTFFNEKCKGIQHLVNLMILNCGRCDRITDSGIQHLVNLKELDCSGCEKITDICIKHFPLCDAPI